MAERPTACEEWQADLAGWLTAQLAPQREAELRAHLDSCPTCRSEADSLSAVAAVALGALPVPAEPVASQPPPQERPRRLVLAGSVAALLVALGLVVAVTLGARGRDGEPVEGSPIAFTVVPDGASVEAGMIDDDGSTLVHLQASGLDPGTTYALWMSPRGGGDRVPAGTFRPDEHGAVDVRLPCAYPPDRYARVWATTPEGLVALDTA